MGLIHINSIEGGFNTHNSHNTHRQYRDKGFLINIYSIERGDLIHTLIHIFTYAHIHIPTRPRLRLCCRTAALPAALPSPEYNVIYMMCDIYDVCDIVSII
jgi:hypothetical protein